MTVVQTLDVVRGLANKMEVVMEGVYCFLCDFVRSMKHEPGRWQSIDRRYPTDPRCVWLTFGRV
jgi:hypothetical protein